MKRGEFLRRSTLALVGLAVAPAILSDPVEVLPAIPIKKKYYMKVTEEMLKDKDAFEWMLQRYLPKNGNVKGVTIGYDGDDFVKNLRTMIVELQ